MKRVGSRTSIPLTEGLSVMTRKSPTRRHLLAATTFLVAALNLAACSSGQDTAGPAAKESNNKASSTKHTGTVRIAYLQKQGDQQYFVDQARGAKEEAAKLGAEVTVVNLGTDANKAMTEMDTAIAQKFDAIAIVAPDQKIGPQIIDRARQAGIPLIASDDVLKAADGTPAPFVGFDGRRMGEEVGKKAGELYKEAGWDPANTAIMAVSKQDLSVCTDRVDGARDAFTQASGADVKVIPVGTDNSPTDAQNKAAATITANQGVKHWLVWGCNDESETGAVTALQNSGVKPANIIGVGLGAYLTCKDWAADQNTGNKAALYISGEEVGRSAVQALVSAVRDGKPLPPKTIAKTTIVDKSNWRTAGVDCV